MDQGRHREVALLAVDDLGREDPPAGVLEHALATLGELQLGRAGGGQLDELVVEERHARLQAPGHRHVVHALDRVVDEHHLACPGGAPGPSAASAPGAVMCARHELPAGVAVDEEVRSTTSAMLGVRRGRRTGRSTPRAGSRVAARQRRVPVVAGEDLVGALARLHDRDVSVTCSDSRSKATTSWLTIGSAIAPIAAPARRRSRSPGTTIWWWSVANSLGDDVGELELVALPAAGRLEADAEGRQAVLARLGEQPDDEAGVQPAGQQHADRHVGDHPALDRDPQRLRGRRPPSRSASIPRGRVAAGRPACQ